jgi:hypothetical protein
MAPSRAATKPIETEEEPKEVVFYSWIENQPSSLVQRISGGRKFVTADKQVAREDMKEVRFRLGMYATTDPEIIAALDKDIKAGADITRSYEVFLSKTMKPEAFTYRARTNP